MTMRGSSLLCTEFELVLRIRSNSVFTSFLPVVTSFLPLKYHPLIKFYYYVLTSRIACLAGFLPVDV